MTQNVEITNGGNDNNAGIIRKFSRRVQGAGFLRRMRKRQYFSRSLSDAVKKKQALRRIERQKKHEKLVKEGREPELGRRRR